VVKQWANYIDGQVERMRQFDGSSASNGGGSASE
jgi:hypothetical protein